MSPSNRNLVSVLIVFTIALQWSAAVSTRKVALSDDASLYPKSRVSVLNKLEDNSDVTVHCKSKDDDLGIHVIKPGQSYSWTFRPNIFQTTLFFCGINTKDGSGTFPLYDGTRDSRFGKDFNWNVYKDGVLEEHIGYFFKWTN